MKILTLLIGCAALVQPALFGDRRSLEVGPGSGEVLIADLNRDGHLDIVTKHLLHNRVTVSLGDGTGGFRRGAGSLELPYSPGAVSLGDANGDRIPDLAMASRRDGAEFAAVHPGDGKGGFTKSPDHRVHDAMQYYKPVVQLIDINEDGRADLVVANGRRNTIQVLIGDGRGGFGGPMSIALDAGGDGYSFVLVDVNHDKHLDLVSATSTDRFRGPNGHIAVALGNGKGQFAKAASLAADSPRIETVADVNGDSHLDLIVGHAAPRLTVMVNDGRGGFSRWGASLVLPSESPAVVAADLNGDGRIDLAAATAQSVSVFLGTGRGFAAPAGSPFRAGPGAYKIAVADLNRDGKKDLVASSFEGTALTLLFGR